MHAVVGVHAWCSGVLIKNKIMSTSSKLNYKARKKIRWVALLVVIGELVVVGTTVGMQREQREKRETEREIIHSFIHSSRLSEATAWVWVWVWQRTNERTNDRTNERTNEESDRILWQPTS